MKRPIPLLIVLVVLGVIALLVPAAAADYKKAVDYYNQGQFEKAIQELKPDLDASPNWESGHRLLGLCYLALKNNALAVSSFTRAVQLKSTAFSTYRGLGLAYFNMQRYEDAVQALNQGESFASEEEKYSFYHIRGSAYFRLQNYNEAVNDMTAAIPLKQTDWTDFSELGIAYFNLNRIDEAIQALQKADSMKPGQSVVAENLGKAYFKKGVAALTAKQYGQAVEFLQKAKDYDPKNGYVSYNLGEAYMFQKNYPAAEKAYNQAVEVLPNNAEVYSRLGLACEKLKKYDLALSAYQKANGLSPSPSLKEAINRVTEAKKAKI